jgi:hypothetical protein
MACRISCGMIRSGLALVLALAAGCRGETAAPSEPPKAAAKTEADREPDHGAAKVPETEAERAPEEAPVTTTTPPIPERNGPSLSAEAVVPHFQRWWKEWSAAHMATHPLKGRLEELVATGGTVKSQACDVLAEHVSTRAPMGSPELLFGDPDALRGLGDRCWWVHHDGMMGAGLGAALAIDGRVLAVWVVLEG